MLENELSGQVVDTAFRIHSRLGPGLFESVYEEVLCFELQKQGLSIERQKTIPIKWGDVTLNHAFKADIIIEKTVLLEIKSVELLSKVHYKQVLTYLKLTGIKLGLLINFNEALIKDGIYRIANGL